MSPTASKNRKVKNRKEKKFMDKLDIKGGRTETEKANHEQEVKARTETAAEKPPETSKAKSAISAEELRKAWEKLESYKPLTEQALGEVLEEFLKGRRD